MVLAAQAVRGVGGARVEFVPEPPDRVKHTKSFMASPPPAAADPKSPEYAKGTRCFRSEHPALGIVRFCKPDVQVGTSVIPGDHEIIRFTPVGFADAGELITAEPDVIAKVEAHHLYKTGAVVDAVVAHGAAQQERAANLVAQIRSDPALRAALTEALSADTVETFMGEVETKKPGKKRH